MVYLVVIFLEHYIGDDFKIWDSTLICTVTDENIMDNDGCVQLLMPILGHRVHVGNHYPVTGPSESLLEVGQTDD